MFLFFWQFKPWHSYKGCSYKEKVYWDIVPNFLDFLFWCLPLLMKRKIRLGSASWAAATSWGWYWSLAELGKKKIILIFSKFMFFSCDKQLKKWRCHFMCVCSLIFSCDEQLKKWRCHSVRPFVTFFSFSVFGVGSVFGMSTGCFKVSQGCFSISVLSVSRKFQECNKKISRVFNVTFKGLSRKFQGCLKEASMLFWGYFMGVSRVFQGIFKGVSRKF